MKEKTRVQIQNMKEQTFGVEVEMNHIAREKAAKLAAEYFGSGRYGDTAARNGYSTVSAWDADGREWKFQIDTSVFGPSNEVCEMVTPILRYKDIELLQGLIRSLRKAGAKSDATRNCGVHIHIGGAGHTAASIRNLVNLMASHEDLLVRAINISRSRISSYCGTVNPNFVRELNRVKPETMSDLADIWYTTQNAQSCRHSHYNSSRYHMLNLHALFTKGTIEFRLFEFDGPSEGRRGGLHAGELKAYIQLCLALSQAAKDQKCASPKPRQRENPNFAMRTWLIRLGFVGPEFKTAREHLTKRLGGDPAFRFGR